MKTLHQKMIEALMNKDYEMLSGLLLLKSELKQLQSENLIYNLKLNSLLKSK